jgi:hypothetical protein
MAWRVAKSLDVLLAEINSIAPNRSKASDGSIGDEDHQAAGSSDHLPNDADVVCARDYTHDPDDGADMHVIAEQLRKRNHPAVKYVIWNRRIWSKARNSEGWRAYSGSNPHTKHMHVSAGVGSDGHSTGPYDDTTPWGIASSDNGMGDDMIGLKQGDEGEQVKALQGLLTRSGFSPGVHDGQYGSKTAAAVLAMRKSQGSSATDGINFTGAAYEQLFVALIKKQAAGVKGDRGPAGPTGPAGKDGVLKLPAAVTINGTVTALKQ